MGDLYELPTRKPADQPPPSNEKRTMTCIEFLADFAHLLILRASKEGIRDVQAVFYNLPDGGSGVDVVGPAGGTVSITLTHPLDALLNHSYKPELTTEIWTLFLSQEKPHRFPPSTGTLQ